MMLPPFACPKYEYHSHLLNVINPRILIVKRKIERRNRGCR
jgi:hypothetical protein